MSSKNTNIQKSLLSSILAGVMNMPLTAFIPFIPALILISSYGYSGFLVQAFIHLGLIIGKICSSRIILKFGPRVAMIFGSLFQMVYYFFLTQAISWHTTIKRLMDPYMIDSYMVFLMIVGIFFGIGIQLSSEGSQRYAQQAQKQSSRSKKDYYQKLSLFITQFMGMCALPLSGWYFYTDANYLDMDDFQGYMFILGIFAVFGLAMSWIMPRPITKSLVEEHNDLLNVGLESQTENYRDIRIDEGSPTKYMANLFGGLFTVRMLIHLPFILFVSSITTLYESLVFLFLSFNADDKTTKPQLALAFFVLIGYWLVQILFGFLKCEKCFDTHDLGRRKTRVCGSIVNFFILSIALVVVTLGALSDNYKIDIPFLRNFSLYAIVSLIIGLCLMIMNKQRKSLVMKTRSDQVFYKSTLIAEDIICLLYQVFLFLHLYLNDYDEWGFKKLIYYELIPYQFAGTLAFGVCLQLLVCMCVRDSKALKYQQYYQDLI